MAIEQQPGQRISVRKMATLMLAVFTVSIGYGVTLPLLPYALERSIGAGITTLQVSRHTGLLAAIYLLALVLFAPSWGQLSDRIGRTRILILGLCGFATTMLVFSFLGGLWPLYLERFLSGMFAAAITPVASALVGDVTSGENSGARRLTMVSLAGMSGFLLGPMLGVFVSRMVSDLWGAAEVSTSMAVPLRSTAFLAAVALILACGTGTNLSASGVGRNIKSVTSARSDGVNRALLALTFVVSSGVGAFEVDLALRGEGVLGLAPYQIALMFTECSLIMILAQVIAFSPWLKPISTRWLIAPSLALLAGGLFVAPYAASFPVMLAVVAAVSGTAGILAPILTYWISLKAGLARGSALGRQTAASSLGGAVGSVLGGFLLGIGPLSNSSFILISGGTLVAALLSFRLPRSLAQGSGAISLPQRSIRETSATKFLS